MYNRLLEMLLPLGGECPMKWCPETSHCITMIVLWYPEGFRGVVIVRGEASLSDSRSSLVQRDNNNVKIYIYIYIYMTCIYIFDMYIYIFFCFVKFNYYLFTFKYYLLFKSKKCKLQTFLQFHLFGCVFFPIQRH